MGAGHDHGGGGGRDTSLVSASTHVVVDGVRAEEAVLADLRAIFSDRYGIRHCTVQIEPEAFSEAETPI